MEYFRIHRNAGDAVFVKTESFFRSQGGLTESWGRGWTRVRARSIEHARKIGEKTLPMVHNPFAGLRLKGKR